MLHSRAMTERNPFARRAIRRVATPLGTGIAYFVTAFVTLQSIDGTNGLAILWPASGLLLAILSLTSTDRILRHVIAAAVASFSANLLSGSPIAQSGLFTIANIVEPLVALWVLRSHLQSRLSFSEPQGLACFCISGFIGAAASATIASTVAPGALVQFWFSWFSTDLLGILVVAPLLLIGAKTFRSGASRPSRLRILEMAALLAMVGVVASLTFVQTGAPIMYIPMLAVLIATTRLGPIGAAGGVLIVAVVSTLSIGIWSDPPMLFDIGPNTRVLYLQFYLLVLFTASLPIAALMASRDQLVDRLAERMRLLELAENAANVGHWRLDTAHNTITWSQEVFNIHGIDGPEPPPLEKAIEAYHPDDRVMVSSLLEDSISKHRGFDFTARIVQPSGTVRHVRSRGEIDREHEDGSVGLFGIIQDISAQVAHETEIKKARDHAKEEARKAKIMADTDQLTGIANRRRITDELDRAVSMARRHGQALSIAIFDIDHFKRINDTYGHQVGDVVLKRVAKTAVKAVRRGDVVGRFGGEEFVIVLPHASAQTALVVTERVRSAIEAGGHNPNVTVSIGIAELAEGETCERLLQRADEALYVAKKEGRNTLRLAA